MATASRYEMRRLGPEHLDWARAIVAHSAIFASPVWSVMIPDDNKTARCYAYFDAVEYSVRHQIDSGYSLGMFDREYEFRHGRGRGELLWDLDDDGADQTKLLQQMDFPLMSVALAHDGFCPLDPDNMMELMDVLPPLSTMYAALAAADDRDPKTWHATSPRQVLFINGTATRIDGERKGLMKHLSHSIMRTAAQHGFCAIQVDASHDAVTHIWTHPLPPFKADIVAHVDCQTVEEEDENGDMVYPMRPSTQNVSRVYVTLK